VNGGSPTQETVCEDVSSPQRCFAAALGAGTSVYQFEGVGRTCSSTLIPDLCPPPQPAPQFTLFYGEIPSKELDWQYEQVLGSMYGGMCYFLYENNVEQWPYAFGEPGGGDPRNNYWIMVTGPRFDALGRPCDPYGPDSEDGTGAVWSASTTDLAWSVYSEESRLRCNRSVRGRWGWGLQGTDSNFSDARDIDEYAITNLDFEFKTGEVLYPQSIFNYWSNYTDWEQRGCPNRDNCPEAVRIDPLLEESKDYIYHQLSGTSGENIQVTYRTMVDNLVALANYMRTAPEADMGFAGKPTGYYGFPTVDLWGAPLLRDSDGNTIGNYYIDLDADLRDDLKTYSLDRVQSIIDASDYIQPTLYTLYNSAVIGTGVNGNVNNNNPQGPYYSPYFKQTPWGGAQQVYQSWSECLKDRLEISARTGKPVYAAVSPMLWGAGNAIERGSEYRGWFFTTMCNPDCQGQGAGNEATSPSGVVGDCYENWRCWDKVLSVRDFIDLQIQPIIDAGIKEPGAVMWWSTVYPQTLSASRTVEQGAWWTAVSATNPNITQYLITDFPTSITGPDGTRWGYDDTSEDQKVARWYSVIDRYPLAMRQEIARLGLESRPTLAAWIASHPLTPTTGDALTWPYRHTDGRSYASERQALYNEINLWRKLYRVALLDNADPSDPNDPRLGMMAGTGTGQGWYAPALHRFIKFAWSAYQLHYSNAVKVWVETGTYLPEWNVVTALGGQEAYDGILETINLFPATAFATGVGASVDLDALSVPPPEPA
jgi:hypothetical protein